MAGIANTLSHDTAGNVTRYDRASGDDRFIAWDARNLPVTVTEGASAATATPTARETFRYGPSSRRYYRQSSRREAGTQLSQETFYSGGGYEELRFSRAGTATVIQKAQVTDNVLHVRKSVTTGTGDSATTTTTAHFEYLHRDHLGSVEAISRYADNALSVRQLAYDPYGSRRATAWTRALTATEQATLANSLRETTSRGFTGHEQLDRVGLIHMGGRMYDPVLGRYLSPDAAVSHPGFSQSWNGYAYVSNSPLSYTDPTGMVQAGPGCNVGGVMCLESGGGGFAEQDLTYPRQVRHTVAIPIARPSLGQRHGWGYRWGHGTGPVLGEGGYAWVFGGPYGGSGLGYELDTVFVTVEGVIDASFRPQFQGVGARPHIYVPGVSVPSPRWVSPTGRGVRGCAADGCGHYRAPRAHRTHWGTDYLGTPGQRVVAPASGVVRRPGRPYAHNDVLRLLVIDTHDGYEVKIFYVQPHESLARGTPVASGQVIGVQQSLQAEHPGITEHVHIEIRLNGEPVNPETLIPEPFASP